MEASALYDLTVEADPNEMGPRGAVYGWRVVNEAGQVVYRSAAKVACFGFVDGVRFGRGKS